MWYLKPVSYLHPSYKAGDVNITVENLIIDFLFTKTFKRLRR